MEDKSFAPFSLVHPEKKGQYVYFDPMPNPDLVRVYFKGPCGVPMENTITFETMKEQVALMLSKGYIEEE